MTINIEEIAKMPITEELLDAYQHIYERIDDRVSDLLYDWCSAKGISTAYGVERWSLESHSVMIIQDTSCMGCPDSETHALPIEWLIASREDSQRMIVEKVQAEKKRAEISKIEAQKARLNYLKNQAAKLEAELKENT